MRRRRFKKSVQARFARSPVRSPLKETAAAQANIHLSAGLFDPSLEQTCREVIYN